MALGGTVFADNDERIGKLVFGVENARAIPGVTRALAAVGAASGEYVVQVTEPIEPMTLQTTIFRPTQAGSQIHFGTLRSLLLRRGERNPSRRDYDRVRRDFDVLRGYDIHFRNSF